MNTVNELTALSPVDGRYYRHIRSLSDYYSEYALIRYRVKVEVEYFIGLCQLPLYPLKDVSPGIYIELRKIYESFTQADALEVKALEKETNHDVKAVEYFIRRRFDALELSNSKEFIHFGLTSQDINNTAIPLYMKDANENLIYPAFQNLMNRIRVLAEEWKQVPMLARTHGQPASPTRLGKEFYVFFERMVKQFELLMEIPYAAKMGGATGNFNAHHVAFPDVDWITFADRFVNEGLGLNRSRTTTQIEHYDYMAAWFDGMKRINTILIDLCRDVWAYISLGYFKLKISKNEVGSSAMPHKINPIDFENAEGNLGIANALFEFLSAKLPISRLQRDLTDSTVLRNVGVPVAHTMLALRSIHKGLDKLLLNEFAIQQDLQEHAEVVAEGIQTVLRSIGYPNSFEKLKQLTRTNEAKTMERIRDFILGLDVSDEIKQRLLSISPENYTGINTF